MESNLTKSNVTAILNELQANNDVSFKKTKSPKGFLQFLKSGIGNVYTASKGYDGYFYAIKTDGTIAKYENVTSTTALESASWDVAILGMPVKIIKSPEGIAVASTFGTETTQGRWYFLETITSTPTKVYETPASQNSRFVPTLAISSYTNGLNGMILAGVYGSGPANRDLILSVDGGKTFKVIKQTRNLDAVNSHWHASVFDIYHGLIWASEGDQSTNRAMHVSDDFGATWYTFAEGVQQPTAIVPFANRLVLGNDEDFVGLKYLEKPQFFTNYADWVSDITPLKRFRPGVQGYAHYAETPVFFGNEAYIGYFQYSPIEPNVLMGTGDGGQTWYHLFISQRNTGNTLKVSQLVGLDDDYLYGLRDIATGQYELLFSEKPIWE